MAEEYQVDTFVLYVDEAGDLVVQKKFFQRAEDSKEMIEAEAPKRVEEEPNALFMISLSRKVGEEDFDDPIKEYINRKCGESVIEGAQFVWQSLLKPPVKMLDYLILVSYHRMASVDWSIGGRVFCCGRDGVITEVKTEQQYMEVTVDFGEELVASIPVVLLKNLK